MEVLPQPLKPDLSLIHDYTPEDEHTFRPVAVTHFHGDNKDLYYVSTHHELGTQSTTSKTVRQTMEQYNPQLVIIEGLQTQKGVSPAVDDFAHAEEPAYAAYLAGQKNIPFVGGEPSEPQIFKEMEGKGYSAKDIMAFYLLRNIPVWRRDGELNKEHFDRQANEYLNLQMFDFIPKEKRLTFDEFKV